MKTVVITGASSGLGEAMAHLYAKKNYNLVLAARNIERLNILKESLSDKYQIDIKTIKTDVTNKDSVKKLIDLSVEHFGKIDIFIANAGQGMWSRFGDIKDPDHLNDLMQTNYMGVVYCLYYALSHLKKSSGSFVAISSIQGIIPVPYHTGYVASKFAVNGLIETMRLEEPHVHFLLAMPSWIAGTKLRAHALTSDDKSAVKVKTTHNKNVISAYDCALIIIKAIADKEQDLFIPRKYRFIRAARVLMKNLVDKIVVKKTESQLRG